MSSEYRGRSSQSGLDRANTGRGRTAEADGGGARDIFLLDNVIARRVNPRRERRSLPSTEVQVANVSKTPTRQGKRLCPAELCRRAFRVLGFGFGFQVSGFGPRFSGFEFRVPDFRSLRFRVRVSLIRVAKIPCPAEYRCRLRILGFGFQVQGVGCGRYCACGKRGLMWQTVERAQGFGF